MPATAGDIRRKAMKKKVDEGYIKQKPGKTNTKVNTEIYVESTSSGMCCCCSCLLLVLAAFAAALSLY